MMQEEIYFDYAINENDGGTIYGYVCHIDDDNWKNFLYKTHMSEEFVLQLEKKYKAKNISYIGVIKGLYIEKDERGKGYGTELLSNMIDELRYLNAQVILLESDEGEKNKFSLIQWYIDCFNFERESHKKGNPILACFLES